MTVKELIDRLQELDGNMTVLIHGDEIGAYPPNPKVVNDVENDNGAALLSA